MLSGWKRAAVLAGIVLALAFYTLWRSVPEKSVIDQLETRLAAYSIKTLGGQPRPLNSYVRHYAVINPRVAADLPFTTVPGGLSDPPDKRLIAGVLTAPDAGERPGVRRVAKRDLPVVVRGGCATVNVLYDPSDDQLIDAWCNLADRTPASATPQG